MFKSEYPRPNHFILHFSDVHLIAGPGLLYGDVDSEARFRQILSELAKSEARPEAIVFTGDLADTGESEAYLKLKAIVEPAAAAMGAEVIWVMGNHDDRSEFRVNLLGEPASQEPINSVRNINGLRLITLDTSVPGKHYGGIDVSQLDWLTEVLSTPAPHGSILAMHHPPVPSVLDLAVAVELRDQKRLAEVIRGSDIRSIIAGHLHYSSHATFAGIPVSVASATCYTQDLNVRIGGTRGRDGAQAFNLVHVYEDTVLHSVVPIGSYETVGNAHSRESTHALLEKDLFEGYIPSERYPSFTV